jgi:hypothetical protein
MKAPWNNDRLTAEERQQWMVTARLFGVALGLAVICDLGSASKGGVVSRLQ